MLEIEHNVKDTTNYVKCLVTSHNAAILEKVRENPIRIFHIKMNGSDTHIRAPTHTYLNTHINTHRHSYTLKFIYSVKILISLIN